MANRIDGLPDFARVWSEEAWTVERELLAEIVEGLDAVRIQVAGLTGDKKVKRWKRLTHPLRPKPKTRSRWVDFARKLASSTGRK